MTIQKQMPMQGHTDASRLRLLLLDLEKRKFRIKLVRVPLRSPIAIFTGWDLDRVPNLAPGNMKFYGYPMRFTREFEAQRQLRYTFVDVMNLCCEFLPEGYSLCFEMFRQDGPTFYVQCPDGRQETEYPSNHENIRDTWLDAVEWARKDAGLQYE